MTLSIILHSSFVPGYDTAVCACVGFICIHNTSIIINCYRCGYIFICLFYRHFISYTYAHAHMQTRTHASTHVYKLTHKHVRIYPYKYSLLLICLFLMASFVARGLRSSHRQFLLIACPNEFMCKSCPPCWTVYLHLNKHYLTTKQRERQADRRTDKHGYKWNEKTKINQK